MMQKTNYKKAPEEIAEAIESSKITDDFLPPPDKLRFKAQTVKITVDLSVSNVSILKDNAIKSGISVKLGRLKRADLSPRFLAL